MPTRCSRCRSSKTPCHHRTIAPLVQASRASASTTRTECLVQCRRSRAFSSASPTLVIIRPLWTVGAGDQAPLLAVIVMRAQRKYDLNGRGARLARAGAQRVGSADRRLSFGTDLAAALVYHGVSRPLRRPRNAWRPCDPPLRYRTRSPLPVIKIMFTPPPPHDSRHPVVRRRRLCRRVGVRHCRDVARLDGRP